MYRKVYLTRSVNAKEKVRHMVWTNEMDRCFSKILAEHVSKGNKLDKVIKPATYAAVVAELNENFGLDLTKDHLKNRLKTWRKQYGVLKEILAQKGFKWDKARKIIVADDAVWNDYIKAHPEAKHFRAKFIENYEELCIIVGNDQSAASSSDNGAEVDVDLLSDNEGMDTAVMSVVQSDDKKTKILRWTEEMDRCLSKILVEEVQKGHKVNNIIQTEAYITAVSALNEIFGPDVTKDHIKNRLKTWKKQYGVLKELLSHNGFRWDETEKMVIGDDSVWNDYIKTHPDAKFLRARSIENYDELRLILDNGNANGCWSASGAKGDLNPTFNNEEHVETPLQNILVDEEMSKDDSGDDTQGSSQQTRARRSSSSHCKQPFKKRRDSYVMIEMMSAMAANVGRIADALAINNQSVCLDEIFEMVQNIPGFDDDLIIEACEFLSFDEKRAKMFLKLDERLRKLWLLKRLRGPSG
ncbi:L10-interacting MYB domain-containing protein-like [Cornus florida]|uniref:L10-interacting MYB domain-containing protein-like n=1 Tax=Cornus florida TaxID=4283 RepID=UPI002899F66D|nr:L10-interacting MYB domain-containing protein-like [Cornus florida]XP_059625006.1 L10-interacting MYB domain-containing protein-like [Cornus florida]